MANKRPGGGRSTSRQAAKFLGVSVLSGAVLAGIALPAAGALGLVAKGSVEGFDEIPANLKRPPLSQKTSILDSEGGLIATVYSRDRTVVPLKDISPYMRKAIVAIEDERFYEHGAIDLKGILRALNKNARSGEVSEGASTLTQQYVKNVFVEEAGNNEEKFEAATQQTLGRKIKELKYAIQVEEELGKKKILENYLNITYFSQQAYGVEAAAKRYFSKSAKDLELQEAALLAGIVQSPSRWDPVANGDQALKRRNLVLDRMAEQGHVSKDEAAEAKKKDLGLDVSKPKNGCITAVNGAGFFCDYVRRVFLGSEEFGKTREERNKRWNEGGLTIRTTLDPKAQKSVQASVKEHVYQSDEVAAAVSLVEPGTGKILGMGQSRPYGLAKDETTINYSVNKSMGGGMGYQPGSTYKPIVAAAALERGVNPSRAYPSPYEMTYPSPVPKCEGQWSSTNPPKVSNENESEVGPYGMREATAKSVNTYYVQLISDIGICPVVEMSEKMGIEPAGGDELKQVPSVTLGVQEMSPLTMAAGYAAFASRGTYCTPVAIESIKDANGKSLDVPKSKCTRAMNERTADTINTLLKGVVQDGTGTQAGLTGRPSAGKTGTTDSRYAAWFVGYTPNLSGAVWVGDPQHQRKMIDITIGGDYHAKVFGGGVPGPIWRDAVAGALEGKEAPGFVEVPIADPPKKDDKEKDEDDRKPRDRFPGGGNGGLIGGGGDGGTEPNPTFSIPEGFIQGPGNGSGGRR
ncbi:MULTISPECIES: transglycosylase domain-containing protein [Streptomyces]|uniref:transglycosylase domain-containing protein n=1 Tax=Streptomyces TaxID=1883 RepID=UPI001D14F3FD|nr:MULTISPECIES: transglycosylase domain-containing protein [Streptomyces]MCC3652638.1 transglycosylase domain-containing protein [Streptomyces sp. S07_1.15]WSQ72726.1 transglycosylase domain-containing protein [Streptomyces xinghaiensis]